MGLLSRLFGQGEDKRGEDKQNEDESADPVSLSRYYVVGDDGLTMDFRETAWCILEYNEDGWGFVHNRRLQRVSKDEPLFLYAGHSTPVIQQENGQAYVVILAKLRTRAEEDIDVADMDNVMPFPQELRGEEIKVMTTLSEEHFDMLRLPFNVDDTYF